MKESGYRGEPVDLYTPVGRYIDDKEVTQAMIPMLNAVGINARLRTPEWATLWSDVQKGKTPFYYMGRGSVVDPSPALSAIFRDRRVAAHRHFRSGNRQGACGGERRF